MNLFMVGIDYGVKCGYLRGRSSRLHDFIVYQFWVFLHSVLPNTAIREVVLITERIKSVKMLVLMDFSISSTSLEAKWAPNLLLGLRHFWR